jgi:hypothetical protein
MKIYPVIPRVLCGKDLILLYSSAGERKVNPQIFLDTLFV